MADGNKDLFDFANQTITKNVQDTADNNTTLNAVNEKGELLIGNGNGPSQLNPSTGVNGDKLIKDSTKELGVRWGQPQVLPDVMPCIVSVASVLSLLPEQNGSTITYASAGGEVNLPVSPPNGTTYYMNSLVNDPYTRLLAPGSSIRDRCDVFPSVQITNAFRFSVTYNLATAQWIAYVDKGTPLLAPVPP